ncbi:MAG: gas vesicle protein [Oceanicoccus sp.]|jgi:gas vesicle protein
MGKKAGKIALGIGLVAGAVTGLFFAPEEGKKLRKKIIAGDGKGILDDVVKMGGEIGDMVEDFVSRPPVQDALKNAKGKIADVADIEHAELDEILKKANKKADSFKKKVGEYVKEQKAILNKKAGKKKKSAPKKKAAPKKKTSTVKKKAPAKKKAAPKKKKD